MLSATSPFWIVCPLAFCVTPSYGFFLISLVSAHAPPLPRLGKCWCFLAAQAKVTFPYAEHPSWLTSPSSMARVTVCVGAPMYRSAAQICLRYVYLLSHGRLFPTGKFKCMAICQTCVPSGLPCFCGELMPKTICPLPKPEVILPLTLLSSYPVHHRALQILPKSSHCLHVHGHHWSSVDWCHLPSSPVGTLPVFPAPVVSSSDPGSHCNGSDLSKMPSLPCLCFHFLLEQK